MTIIKTTEKNHWINGYDVRHCNGGKLKMLTFSIGNIAIMISNRVPPYIQLFKLI